MKIALFNNRVQEPDCTHWTGIEDGMKKLGITYKEIECRTWDTYRQWEELRYFEPDLIIYAVSDPLYSGVYKKIRETHKCPIVAWYCDIRTPETGGEFDFRIDGYLDALFVSNDGQEEYYKKLMGFPAVHYLPQAVIPVEKPLYDPDYDFDIVFVGSMHQDGYWGQRYRFIDAIRQNVSGFKHLNGGNPDERMELYRKMPLIYGSSKISLDISHVWTVKKYCSNRYFVIPGMGGFSLTKRFPGCEEIYPEGTGKVYFDTPQEAVEKAKYYIEHKKERDEIRLKGLEHCKEFHTYPVRIKEMLVKMNLWKQPA